MYQTLIEFFDLFKSKSQFGASGPRLNVPNKVIWHHSNGMNLFPCAGTKHHTVDIIDEAHKVRWPGFTSRVCVNSKGQYYHVGYHLVIDFNNKKVTQTRGFNEEGAHTIGMNLSSIGVLMIGNYDTCSGEEITFEDEKLIREAYTMIKMRFPHMKLSDNEPHRRYASKSCYGNGLRDSYIQYVLGMGVEAIEQQKALIVLLQQLVAKLLQQLANKRLSLREI